MSPIVSAWQVVQQVIDSGLEPPAFRLVTEAQHLNLCDYSRNSMVLAGVPVRDRRGPVKRRRQRL